ncbi:hypothetical protein PV326_004173 [Microctonus aethiopoides]|nr:hypothetical protein PV326_004173 [Microctonus aethiopoides]
MVKGQKNLALIDSGATRSFVGQDIGNSLKDYPAWSRGMMTITDGNSITLVGCNLERKNNEYDMVLMEPVIIDAPSDPGEIKMLEDEQRMLIPPEPEIIRVTPLLKHSIYVQGH